METGEEWVFSRKAEGGLFQQKDFKFGENRKHVELSRGQYDKSGKRVGKQNRLGSYKRVWTE